MIPLKFILSCFMCNMMPPTCSICSMSKETNTYTSRNFKNFSNIV